MPSCCCIPGCRSNYKTEAEKVAVFQIPLDEERRALWLKKIPRKDWVPGARSVVCIKHFKPEDVIKEDSIQRPDGSILVVPRSNLKLKPTAFPCIFKELPAYLSVETQMSRKDPNDRLLEQVARENQKVEDFLAMDIIKSIGEVKNYLLNRSSWYSVFDGDNVFFYKLDLSQKPISVSSYIQISADLPASIYISGYAVHQLKKKLPCSSCIEMLSTDKDLVIETNKSSQNYFNLVEKGGLMYPNEFTTRVFLLCLKVFKCMLKNDNEHLFLTDNVKKVLTSVTYEKIIEMDTNQCCSKCGEDSHNLALKCVSIFFNIFLNNYIKVKNNVVHSSCQKRKYDMLMSSIH